MTEPSLAELLAAAEPTTATPLDGLIERLDGRGPAARRPPRRPGDRAGRPGRDRGPRRDQRLARGPAGLAVRGRPGPPRRRPRLRRGGGRGRRRRRASSSARSPRSTCRSSSSADSRTGPGRRGRLVVRRPEPRPGGRRDHRHGRQDDDLVPRGRGARGGRHPDRDDRHGRDPDRRRPGGERGPRHDARGARAPARRSGRWRAPATRPRSSRRRRTGSRSSGSTRSPTTWRS